MKVDDIGYCHDLEKMLIPALSPEYRSALRDTLEQRLQTGIQIDAKQLREIISLENFVSLSAAFCNASRSGGNEFKMIHMT